MYSTKLIYLLLLTQQYHCLEIKQYFENINQNVLTYNRKSAKIAWEYSVNPGNPELSYQSAELQRKYLKWQHEACERLAALDKRHLLNGTQSRQTYLLCRGPKYTYEEARQTSKLYEELQRIYTEAEICIPTEANITNIKDKETAILNYLTAVKNIEQWKTVGTGLNKKMINFLRKDKSTEIKNEKVLCLKGEDDFEKLMEFSRNDLVLEWVWSVWREKVGPPMKETYLEFVEIQNRAARRNGYPDIGSSWRDELEIPNLRQFCLTLYEEVKPLYTLLHGVMRYFLRMQYGRIVPERGLIPAHFLGNLWSQNWESMVNIMVSNDVDLDRSIMKLNWTVPYMAKRAADFYQSLGLPAMTDTFWRESLFTRESPETRCHGTAADMFQDGDFRLLYCANTTKQDFYVLHHEMGHIQFYMAYEKQPALFRQANAALHESIGDAIMIGAMTPQHVHRLGLINDTMLYENDSDVDQNDRIIDEGNPFVDGSDPNVDISTSIGKRNQRQVNKNNPFFDENNANVGRGNPFGDGNEQNVDKNNAFLDKAHTNIDDNNSFDLKTKLGVIGLNRNGKDIGLDGFNRKIDRNNPFDRDVRNPNNNNLFGSKTSLGFDELKPLANKNNPFMLTHSGEYYLNNINMNAGFDRFNPNNIQPNPFNLDRLNPNVDNDRNNAIGLNNENNDNGYNMLNLITNSNDFAPKKNPKYYVQNMFKTADGVLMLKQALNQIPQIPFSLLIDEYRWRLFEGNIPIEDLNSEFWNMAAELQGIAPSMIRNEELFDIGAKFHVADNTPYIRYFLSHFLQHQLFETLCKAAVFGQRTPKEELPRSIPLNRCDIYGSKVAGKMLQDLMSYGHSKHWRDILTQTTEHKDITSTSLLKYYRPLYVKLSKLVQMYDIPVGW